MTQRRRSGMLQPTGSSGAEAMVIYGVALLAGCMLAGVVLGELLGLALGVEANVGGVGIAMLLLVFLADRTGLSAETAPATSAGIGFWSAMYIPIVVAMAAKQNVLAAVSGGWVAVAAGAAAVAASFAMVPVLSRRRTGAPESG